MGTEILEKRVAGKYRDGNYCKIDRGSTWQKNRVGNYWKMGERMKKTWDRTYCKTSGGRNEGMIMNEKIVK